VLFKRNLVPEILFGKKEAVKEIKKSKVKSKKNSNL